MEGPVTLLADGVAIVSDFASWTSLFGVGRLAGLAVVDLSGGGIHC